MEAISSLQTSFGISITADQSAQSQNAQAGQTTSQPTSTQTTNAQVQQADDKKKSEDLKKQLSTLTNQLNKEMSPLNFNVKFGFNDKVDEMYVSVTEKSSNKLIRKIPSDEAMNLMEKMREIVGMIFDKKA